MAIEFQHLNFGQAASGETPEFTIFKLLDGTFDDYMGVGDNALFSSELTLPIIKEWASTGIFMFSYSDSILTDDIIFEVAIPSKGLSIRNTLMAPTIKNTVDIVRDGNNNIISSKTITMKPGGRIVREQSEALQYTGPFFTEHAEAIES